MSWQADLTTAAAPLTAAEAARAVSALLSVRTMEDWLQGRRTPPDWTHAYIIAAVTRAAARKTRRRGAQASVAALLRVDPQTISRRERGEIPITHEAALALLSLPKKRARRRTQNTVHEPTPAE